MPGVADGQADDDQPGATPDAGPPAATDCWPDVTAAAPTTPATWTRVGRGPRRRTRWDRPPDPKDWRFYVGWLGRTLIVLGLLMFLFVAYQLWGTGIETARAQNRLEDQFAELLADDQDTAPATTTTTPVTTVAPTTAAVPGSVASGSTPATTGATTAPTTVAPTTPPTTAPVVVPGPDQGLPVPERGDAVAKLVIPRIGVDWIVVAGVSRNDLKEGPGHFDDTPYPGQLGNAAIAGHRTTHGAPFGNLDQLDPGDEIQVTMGNGETYVYVVNGSEVVTPDDYHVITDSDPSRATLTLVTCTPKWSSTHRLIVHADLDPTRSGAIGEATDNTLDEPAVAPTEDDPTFVTTTAATTTPASSPTASTPSDTVPATSPSTPATSPSTPASTPTTEPVAEPDTETPDAFAEGWFADRAAWPQIVLWFLALAALTTLGWWLARFWKREWVGVLAVVLPFVVCLYFFFQNVNRLLPAGL